MPVVHTISLSPAAADNDDGDGFLRVSGLGIGFQVCRL